MCEMRRARPLPAAAAVLVGLLRVTGCGDTPTVQEPALSRRQSLQAEDGPEESRILGAGCALAFQTHGRLYQVVVPRSRLPEELRRAAGVRRAGSAKTVLHVETFSLSVETETGFRDVAFACAGDRTASAAAMRRTLSSADAQWMQLGDASVTPLADSSANLTSVAANALMAPLIARAKQGRWIERRDTLSSQANSGVLIRSVPGFLSSRRAVDPMDTRQVMRPAPDAEVAVPIGALRLRHDYQLPTVTIVGTQNNWLINASDLYWLLHSWKYYDGQFAFAGYFDCAQASETWLAQNDELDRLTADSAELSQAIASTDSYSCEHQSGGLTICMDLFIVAKKAGPFNGDSRGPDSSAPYQASRVQVYLDLDQNIGRFYVNSSSTWVPVPASLAKVDPYPHGPKALQIQVQDSTHKIVSYEFYNGYCDIVGTTLCPPTTGSVLFVKGANGIWVPNDVVRVGFPTLAIYRDTGSGFQIQYNSPEGRWTDLFGSHQLLDEWRSKMGLPPGCYLQ